MTEFKKTLAFVSIPLTFAGADMFATRSSARRPARRLTYTVEYKLLTQRDNGGEVNRPEAEITTTAESSHAPAHRVDTASNVPLKGTKLAEAISISFFTSPATEPFAVRECSTLDVSQVDTDKSEEVTATCRS
jgi:hypothetical protein